MILEQVPEVQRLSPDEKWQLIDELWQELLPRSDSEPQPEILALLEGRVSVPARVWLKAACQPL